MSCFLFLSFRWTSFDPRKKKKYNKLTVVHLRSHFFQNGLQRVERPLVPAGHHRGAVASPLFPTGNAHADVPHALLGDLGRASLGVLVPLITSVDDDVARLEASLEEAGDGPIDGAAGLDEDDDAAVFFFIFFEGEEVVE